MCVWSSILGSFSHILLDPLLAGFHQWGLDALVEHGKTLRATLFEDLGGSIPVEFMWKNAECVSRTYLVGGFEHFLFSHISGIIIPID